MRGEAPAREGHVVFAVSAPRVSGERYAVRRGIGSWYREPGEAGIRAAATNPAGRSPCMAYSLVMPSARAAAMTMAILDAIASRVAIRAARITHGGFCGVVGGMAGRDRTLPKPPPRPRGGGGAG